MKDILIRASTSGRDSVALRHEALFYDGPERFVSSVGPYIQGGLAAGEPVMVMAPPDRLAALRMHLGGDAQRVSLVDMSVIGRNPARIIPAWRAFADHHEGRPVRGVGEPIWPGRPADELKECQIHESLLGLALVETPGLRLVCPYDARSLDPAILDEARRSHPADDTAAQPGAPLGAPLPPAPADALEVSFSAADVRTIRDVAARSAEAFGLDLMGAESFSLAAHELAVNSVVHGGGSGLFRVWRSATALTGEIVDGGRIRMPLVGRVRPSEDQENGRGVWLANQLCDLVQLRSGEAGTTVRFQMARP